MGWKLVALIFAIIAVAVAFGPKWSRSPASAPVAASEIRPEICRLSRRSVHRMAEAFDLLSYSGSSARIREADWRALDISAKRAIRNALSMNASCTIGGQRDEHTVRILDESGESVLAEGTLYTFADR